jgi:hypothetical protein
MEGRYDMNQNDNRLGTALWLGLVLSGSACAEAPAERTGSTNVDLRVDGTLA